MGDWLRDERTWSAFLLLGASVLFALALRELRRRR